MLNSYNNKTNSFWFLALLISIPTIILLGSVQFSNNLISIPVILILALSLIFFFSSTYDFILKKIEIEFNDYIFSLSFLFISILSFSFLPTSVGFPTGGILTLAGISIVYLLTKNINNKSSVTHLKINNAFEKILLGAFFLFIFVSMIVVNFKDFVTPQGFSKCFIFIFGGYFFGYYIPKLFFLNKNFINLFVKFIFYIGFSASIFGIITLLVPKINPTNELPGTAISFFMHPNATAFLYCYTIPCALYLIFFEKNKTDIEKLFFSAGFYLMIFNQILTISRSGFAGVCIGIIIFFMFYSRKYFYLLLLILPVAYVFFVSDFTASKGAGTLIGRVGLLATAYTMLTDSNSGLLWGFGTSSIFDLFEDVKLSLGIADSHNYPHNSIVFYILQFGLISAIPLFFFFFFKIGKAIRMLFKRYENFGILLLAVTIIISTFIQAIFEDFVLFPEYYMFHFFMLFFGIMVVFSSSHTFFINKKQSILK
jgi:hypothetical protein